MSDILQSIFQWAMKKKRWPLLFLLGIPGLAIFMYSGFNMSLDEIIAHSLFQYGSLTLFLLAIATWFFMWLSPLLIEWSIRKLGFPRICINQDIANQTLTYETEDGEKRTVTVYKELLSLASGSGFVPVIGCVVQETYRAEIKGIVEPKGFTLEAVFVGGRPIPSQLADSHLSLPPRLLVGSEMLDSIELKIPTDYSGRQRATATRLFLRYVIAALLFRDDKQYARRVAEDMIDIGDWLQRIENKERPIENKGLSDIFKSLSLSMALYGNDLKAALRALDHAEKLNPSDRGIQAIRALFLSALGKTQDAEQLFSKLKPKDVMPDDPSVFHWLAGDIVYEAGSPEEAVKSYELAVSLSEDVEQRNDIHLQAAVVYEHCETLDIDAQTDGVITHLEQIRVTTELPKMQVFCDTLQGHAWAIRGNEEQFKRAFKLAWKNSRELEKTSPNEYITNQKLAEFIKYWQVKGLMKLENYVEARELINELVGNFNECQNVIYLGQLSRILFALITDDRITDSLKEAEDCLTRLIKLSPDDAHAMRLKGAVLLMLAEKTDDNVTLLDEALRLLQKSITLGQNIPVTHGLLGELYDQKGDHVNAKKHYNSALELNEDDKDIWFKLGLLLARKKKYEEAESAFERVVELDTNHAVAWRWLGRLKSERNDFEGAVKACQRATEITPTDATAWNNLAWSFAQVENYDSAEPAAKRSLELDPQNPLIQHTMGYILMKSGRLDEAETHLAAAFKLDSSVEEHCQDYASLLEKLSKYDDAERVRREHAAARRDLE